MNGSWNKRVAKIKKIFKTSLKYVGHYQILKESQNM